MALLKESTKNFILLLLGACVMLAGAGMFLPLQDQDWNYELQYEDDSYPNTEGDVEYYNQLSQSAQQDVDRAIAGERIKYETEGPVPPSVVRKNETYYVFDRYTTFDFGDVGTSGPLLIGVFGLVVMGEAMRRDVTR